MPGECLMKKEPLFFTSLSSSFHLQSYKSPFIKIIKMVLKILTFISDHKVINISVVILYMPHLVHSLDEHNNSKISITETANYQN
jgi:hypothetical protein